MNTLSMNIFELSFYQHKKWKHYLSPIEIGKNDSHRVVE